MNSTLRPILFAFTLATGLYWPMTPQAVAQTAAPTAPTESTIAAQMKTLRQQSDAARPGIARQLALDIRTLPAGLPKVKLAYGLCSMTTEGDQGKPALTEAATTLAQALTENPVPPNPKSPDSVPAPYLEVDRIIRYEHISVEAQWLADPMFAKGDAVLTRDDEDVQHVDFTLKDLHNKPVTLSALKGKIVMVNFWATWCPPCRKELPALDAIYTHFKDQGLVILSISDEDMFKVGSFIEQAGYHPPVLLDPGGKVHQLFHVEGIPKTFVFDRDGKLVAQTIDERTVRQFLAMLQAAGLHN